MHRLIKIRSKRSHIVRLGWILSDALTTVESQPQNNVTCHLNVGLDKQLEKFSEILVNDSGTGSRKLFN